MRGLRERFARFMQGRYGQNGGDELNRALSLLALIFVVLSLFLPRIRIFYWIGLISLLIVYFRMMSRNYDARYRENETWLNFRYNRAAFVAQIRRRRENAKHYRIFACPGCKQKVRVPKGKGRIEIRCPKCGTEFIKNS